MITTTELVPSVSIDNLLGQRAAIIERVRQAATLFCEVDELVKASLGEHSYAGPSLQCARTHSHFPGNLDDLIKRVDADFWHKLMAESGLWTFMDATARDEWSEAIQHAKVPELTMANIEETFRQLYAARREMFERGVIACFRHLSWDYKTNSPVKFGKRIILRHTLDGWSNRGRFEVTGPHHRTCSELDDLIRVMSVLDGKPEPDHRQAAYHQLSAVVGFGRTAAGVPSEPVELSGLLSIRLYRNGNGHVTFLRPDLVDKLNEIIADHYPGALPPARE